jgi:hypothetical protein
MVWDGSIKFESILKEIIDLLGLVSQLFCISVSFVPKNCVAQLVVRDVTFSCLFSFDKSREVECPFICHIFLFE